MTLFADASALIAIITQESDALDLAHCLQSDETRLYSALSAWETVAGLTRTYHFSVEQSHQRARLFLDTLGFRLVPIGAREFDLAT